MILYSRDCLVLVHNSVLYIEVTQRDFRWDTIPRDPAENREIWSTECNNLVKSLNIMQFRPEVM